MTAAIILAILLWEPGAPALPQRVVRGAVLGMACAAHDLPPALCVAIGWQESRLKRGLTSTAGARGVMQVQGGHAGWLVVEAWQGASALATWKRYRHAHYLRGYACGWRDRSPRCADYERSVMRTLSRLPRWARGGEV